MNIETIPDIEVIEHLDFDAELGCESRGHPSEAFHTGPAAYYQFGPCVHATGYRCAKWVEAPKADMYIECGVCGLSMTAADLRAIPITP